jgi:type I restriction enzyme R subunit
LGFTGTPIFAANSSMSGNPQMRTTEQAFGDKLHTYTIVDAIRDKNVLPFRVDYVNTFQMPETLKDKQVSAIDTEKALLAPERVQKIVEYVLEHFDQKTRRNESYNLKDKRVSGFNSLFATASIEAAKRYYLAFKKAQENLPQDQKLKVGIIYSFAPNEEQIEGILAEEEFETDHLDASSREFLDMAISDYNQIYGSYWDTSSDNFQGYYQQLARKLKEREIDIVIVVNMFLTGFDSTTLNTLWVDKNLHQHGLLQAFSRTNRILNSVKTYGNIVCFRDLEKATQESISLFGNKEAGGIVLLRPYAEYYYEYTDAVNELLTQFTQGQMPEGEEGKKAFVDVYNKILRLKNILQSFDDFEGNEGISKAAFQDFQSTYIEIYNDEKNKRNSEKESIIGDITFEIELVKQVEINVDYILMLVKELQSATGNENKEIKSQIDRAVLSSYTLRSKKDLIERFLSTIDNHSDIDKSWKLYIEQERGRELEAIIAAENLDPAAAQKYVAQAFRDGELQVAGPALTNMLPPKNMFTLDNVHGRQKESVLEKLQAYFDRFFGL